MKKEHMIIAAILAVLLIFCLWYTRPRTVEQFCPAVDLGDCTGLRLSGFVEDGNMDEYNTVTKIFTPGDGEFEAIIEMLDTRRFSVHIANLLPQGTRTHRTEVGDFNWRMYFYFEDVEMSFGTQSGTIFGFENFYGDLSLSYNGEEFEDWRVTTPGKEAWLGEIMDILSGSGEWAEAESSPTDIYVPPVYDWSDYVPDKQSFGLRRDIGEIAYAELSADSGVDIGVKLCYDDEDLLVFQAEKGLYAYDLNSEEILVAVNTEKAVGVSGYQGSAPGAAVRVSPEGETIQLYNTDNRDYCIYIDPYAGVYWFDEYTDGYISETYDVTDGYIYSDRADGTVGRISEQYYFRGEERWQLFENFDFPVG